MYRLFSYSLSNVTLDSVFALLLLLLAIIGNVKMIEVYGWKRGGCRQMFILFHVRDLSGTYFCYLCWGTSAEIH